MARLARCRHLRKLPRWSQALRRLERLTDPDAMCGIAISVSFASSAATLRLPLLAHRGPDGSGEWRSPDRRCWLGHTRLAILDLSANGAQPMIDSTTGNVIIFNGEIYNHLELRETLKETQHQWRSTSDTETLLVAYARWGPGMLHRLKGNVAKLRSSMFSGAGTFRSILH